MWPLALSLALLALAPSAFAQNRVTYCCNDDRGKAVCGDILPQQCYGRAYREINERGMTVRRVDPPLTAEQRAQKAAEAKRAKEEELAREEDRRRREALLSSYSSEKDIEYLRDRALRDIESSIAQEKQRHAEAMKRKKKLDDEMQFYKKNPPPRELTEQIKDNDAVLRSHAAVIEAKQREMDAVRAKYDEEKRRYAEITRGTSSRQAESRR